MGVVRGHGFGGLVELGEPTHGARGFALPIIYQWVERAQWASVWGRGLGGVRLLPSACLAAGIDSRVISGATETDMWRGAVVGMAVGSHSDAGSSREDCRSYVAALGPGRTQALPSLRVSTQALVV